MTAILLVVAVGFLGPIFAYVVARLLAPALGALSPVGGFLASANLRTATRRFSSASTPLVLTVAMSCTLLFSTTTIEHAITQQRHAALTGQLAITTTGPGLPTAALADARATPGVRSAVALTSTTLGPSLGDSGDTLPAQILAGGQGGGLDVGVTAGSLNALHGNTIALGRHRANAAHAHIGERVQIMLGDGTLAHATVVAIYSRDLAFGDALLAPELAAGHQTIPLLGTILIQTDHPAAVARRLHALATRYPGLKISNRATLATATDADREMNRWFGPQFVAEIFAFTSIAVLSTLIMIGLRRRRELGAPAARRRDPPPSPIDGALGGSADHHHRTWHRPGDRRHRAATTQPGAQRRPPIHTREPIRRDPRHLSAPGALGPCAANPASARAPARLRRSGRESRPPVGTWQLATVPARAANLLFILIR